MQELSCYVPLSGSKEESTSKPSEYVLPDGQTIAVDKARFRAPEVLFDPSLIGEEADGVHKVLTYSIRKSDMDLRKKLYQNMVLSGGSTLFKVGWREEGQQGGGGDGESTRPGKEREQALPGAALPLNRAFPCAPPGLWRPPAV